MPPDEKPHRPFLNASFVGTVVIACMAAVAYMPFSPAAVQKREMATMQLFLDQMKAEWAASGHADTAPLDGYVMTVVLLDLRVPGPVDDAVWDELVRRVRAKRHAYQRVSLIRVSCYELAPDAPDLNRGKRFVCFEAK